MEHNLYDNDTDDYYDDDSDTLIIDLSDICDKSYHSEEENETLAYSQHTCRHHHNSGNQAHP